MTIHDVIDMMRSDPKGISMKFGIPLPTVYGWCAGRRQAPAYIITMMLNILLLERRLSDAKNTDRLGSGMVEDPKGIKDACKESESETCKT